MHFDSDLVEKVAWVLLFFNNCQSENFKKQTVFSSIYCLIFFLQQ